MLKFFGAKDTMNVISLNFVNDVKNKRKLLFEISNALVVPMKEVTE